MKSHLLLFALGFAIALSPAALAEAVLDEAFNPALNPGGNVTRLAVGEDGTTTVAGALASGDAAAQPGVARLASDGALDPAFDPGSGPDGAITAVQLGSAGNVYLGGRFENFDGISAPGLVELLPDGSVNPSFAPAQGTSGSPQALALAPDGSLVIGGNFSRLAGNPAVYLGRLAPNAAWDTAFSPELSRSFAMEAGVDCLALQPDGKILAGGSFQTPQGAASLVRLNADGSLDTTFDGNPGPMLYPKAIQLGADGSIFISGMASPDNKGFVRRLHSNGDVDSAFEAPEFYGMVHSLCLQPDGKVVVAGSLPGQQGVVAIRLNTDGSPDADWEVQANGPVLAIANAPDGGVLLGGAFSEIQGLPRNGLARIRQASGPAFHNTATTTVGEFQAFLKGEAGQTYTIEASTDLRNWSVFSTNTATNAGIEVLDSAARGVSHRFFRARAAN